MLFDQFILFASGSFFGLAAAFIALALCRAAACDVPSCRECNQDKELEPGFDAERDAQELIARNLGTILK